MQTWIPKSFGLALSLGLSAFAPGMGHLFLKEYKSGLLFLLSFTVVRIAVGFFCASFLYQSSLRLVGVLVALACLLHLLVVGLGKDRFWYLALVRKRRVAAYFALTLLLGPCMRVGLQKLNTTFGVSLARCVGSSMSPTIHVGDILVIDHRSVTREGVKPGDVVLFDPPWRSLSRMKMKNTGGLKRVVGTAGMRVSVWNGKVYTDGVAATQHVLAYEGSCWTNSRDSAEILISNAHVFVLGDNISASYDSREFGPLAMSNITGVATCILFSRFSEAIGKALD